MDPTQHIQFDYVRHGGHRMTFEGTLRHADRELIVLSHDARPSQALFHAGEPVIDNGYSVVWFLYKDQPFDIGRFYRPDGAWTGCYIDILEPVQWTDDDPHTLQPLVDLALDVWIAPDASFQILDEDEFENAVRVGELSPTQASHARSTLSRVLQSIDNHTFPPAAVQNFDRASH